MSTTEQEKKEEKISRGLTVRTFERKISEDKEKGTPEVKYKSRRIVFPWSRAGKDVDGNDVKGSIPSMAQVIQFCQSEGITTEVQLDSSGENPKGPSVVELVCEAISNHFNVQERVKAQNTPDSAKEDAIRLFMKKTGMAREDAEKFLISAFGAK